MNSTPHTNRLLRPVLLSIALVTTALGVQAAPTSVNLPIERPNVAQPLTALAVTCATNPLFTGRITETASTTTAANRIVDNVVFGYISDVDQAWSCTASIRYSALAWNTTTNLGTFNWGNLINSTSVACNWLVGSTDYLKANSTSDCADSDAEYAMAVTLSPQGVYQADNSHNGVGDFSFAHSDCDTYHGAEIAHTSVSFSSGATSNRPASSNCDPVTIDGTGTTQTIINDRTGPEGSISVNGGSAYASSTSATLTLGATDSVAGVKQMRFSNDGTNWSAWEAYGTSKAWTLTAGQGTKTIRTQFRDHNDNESAVYSDSIFLDTADPTGSISINDDAILDGATYTTTPNVSLALSYQDTGSGPYQMQFRNETGAWSNWEPVATTKAWTLSPGDGTKTVGYQVKDNAGRISSATPYSDTIVLDTSLPGTPSVPDLEAGSDTGGSDVDNLTTDATPVFVGTAAAGSTVRLFEGSQLLGTSEASPTDGAWSIESSELGLGDHSITAEATDSAGNSSPRSDALTVSIVESDLQLAWPLEGSTLFAIETLGIDSPAPGMTSVEYLLDGVVVGSVTGGSWTLEYDTTTTTNSTHTLQARAQTPSGVLSSPIVTVTIDNALASTERLEIDNANGRIAPDTYALNGVYAVAAPVALAERYKSISAPEPAPNQIDVYLATWDDLSTQTQDAINEFLAQPLRGEFYALSVLPVTRTPASPPAVTDPCEHVEKRLQPFGPIIGTADQCVHENDAFAISYFLNGTGTLADDAVTSPIANGTPQLIADYMTGLTDALEVYETHLGYPTDWQGKVPVEIHNACGERCGRVLLQGFPAGSIADSVQTIEMSPVSEAPFYLAHHELFHVIGYQYVGPETGLWLLSGGLGALSRFESLRWLAESTADWAAGYVTRAGKPGDPQQYTQSLSEFLGRPAEALNQFDNRVLGREYGAWILHEYLVEFLDQGGANPDVVKEVWEWMESNPGDPLEAVEHVVTLHGSTVAEVLPDFWKVNYFLAYDDSLGAFPSDVESSWRTTELEPDPRTSADAIAPARPLRTQVPLDDGEQQSGDVTVENGGAYFLELVPSHADVFGDFAITIEGVTTDDLDVRVITTEYPAPVGGNPPVSNICVDTPISIANGSGTISVPIEPDCRYALVIFASTDPLGSGDSANWTATFDRKTVVMTDDQWKTLELSWSGGVTNPEPANWTMNGLDDSSWAAAYIPPDPYHAWVDIQDPYDPDWLSSTGRATGHLQSEIWIARLEFTVDGFVAGDGTLLWNVDNSASIWINGHELKNHSGTWSTVTTTAVPQSFLHSGTNTIAVKVFQDGNTNSWSINPTFFQAVLTIPTEGVP